MIRPATPADTERLVALTEATGFFQPHEIDALRGVLDAYFGDETGHACFVSTNDGRTDGFVYGRDHDLHDPGPRGLGCWRSVHVTLLPPEGTR